MKELKDEHAKEMRELKDKFVLGGVTLHCTAALVGLGGALIFLLATNSGPTVTGTDGATPRVNRISGWF